MVESMVVKRVHVGEGGQSIKIYSSKDLLGIFQLTFIDI